MHARERQDQSHARSALFQQATLRPVHMRQDLRPFVQSHAIERLAPGEADLVDGAVERERIAWRVDGRPGQRHVLEPDRQRHAVTASQRGHR